MQEYKITLDFYRVGTNLVIPCLISIIGFKVALPIILFADNVNIVFKVSLIFAFFILPYVVCGLMLRRHSIRLYDDRLVINYGIVAINKVIYCRTISNLRYLGKDDILSNNKKKFRLLFNYGKAFKKSISFIDEDDQECVLFVDELESFYEELKKREVEHCLNKSITCRRVLAKSEYVCYLLGSALLLALCFFDSVIAVLYVLVVVLIGFRVIFQRVEIRQDKIFFSKLGLNSEKTVDISTIESYKKIGEKNSAFIYELTFSNGKKKMLKIGTNDLENFWCKMEQSKSSAVKTE